ncbi:MAG: right-handed parallel beta-helix repeat-containing protein [bacterium]
MIKKYGVSGPSMEFLISPGDEITVNTDSAAIEKIRRSDILVFLDSSGSIAAHRVIRHGRQTDGQPSVFETRGDANEKRDPVIEGKPAGVVISMRKGSGMLALDTAAGRAVSTLIGRFSAAVFFMRRQIARLFSAAASGFFILGKRNSAFFWAAMMADVNMHAGTVEFFQPAADFLFSLFAAKADGRPAGSDVFTGGLIKGEAVWSGKVSLLSDAIVMPGAHLKILPGTIVTFGPKAREWSVIRRRSPRGDIFATDAGHPGIFVYGRLSAEGFADREIVIGAKDMKWAGMAFLGKSESDLRHCRVTGKDWRLSLFDFSRACFKDSILTGPGGIFCEGFSSLELAESSLPDLECRIFAADNSRLDIRKCKAGFAAQGVSAADKAVFHAEKSMISAGKTAVSGAGNAEIILTGCRLSSMSESSKGEGICLHASNNVSVRSCRCSYSASGENMLLDGNSRLYSEGDAVAGGETGFWARGNAAADMQNFSIAGISGCAVRCSGAASMEGRTGSVESADTGFLAEDSASCRLTSVSVSAVREGMKICGTGKVEGVRCCLSSSGGTGLLLISSRASFYSSVFFCAAGAVLHGGAELLSFGNMFKKCGTGVEMTGHSVFRSSRCSWNSCRIGIWPQEASCALLTEPRVAGCAFAGVYLTGGSSCRVSGAVFSRNNIGLYIQEKSEAAITDSGIAGNSTGIKVDGGSLVSVLNGSVEGAQLDGIWCDSGAEIKAENCRIRCNRYGIKEDGLCSVLLKNAVFEGNSAGDHLKYQPR